MEVVVDKMHFKGYTHQWCRLHCNSNDFDKLAKVCIFTQSLHACHLLTAYHLDCGQVDTEICKQTFLGCQDMPHNKAHEQTTLHVLLTVCL